MLKPLLLFLLAFTLSSSNPVAEIELLAEQKQIIAQLSGHLPLDDGTYLRSRSTQEERSRARVYLSDMIHSMGLEAKQQAYTLPNVNPLVDLLFAPFKGANVYTTLPATTASDAYIVIGAHFDSDRNCPGAIDNATGIVINFGALKKLATLEERQVNVILVYFDQEEEDLIGSQAFAQKLKKEGLKVLSVHTMDTMGWDRDGDRAVELELPTEQLKNIYSSVGEELGIPIYTTHVNSTDHHSFRELGFPAAGLTDELLLAITPPIKTRHKILMIPSTLST